MRIFNLKDLTLISILIMLYSLKNAILVFHLFVWISVKIVSIRTAFSRYCTEILALLPFTLPDEPLYLIYAINRVIQVRAGTLEANMKAFLHSLQEDAKKLQGNGITQPQEPSCQPVCDQTISMDLNGTVEVESGDQPVSNHSEHTYPNLRPRNSYNAYHISEHDLPKIQVFDPVFCIVLFPCLIDYYLCSKKRVQFLKNTFLSKKFQILFTNRKNSLISTNLWYQCVLRFLLFLVFWHLLEIAKNNISIHSQILQTFPLYVPTFLNISKCCRKISETTYQNKFLILVTLPWNSFEFSSLFVIATRSWGLFCFSSSNGMLLEIRVSL